VADHLSRLVNEEVTQEEKEIRDEFLDESPLSVSEWPWFANIPNFKAIGIIPNTHNWHQRDKFLHDTHYYVWDNPHLFKLGANNLLRRCVTKKEAMSILWHCHNSPYRGHYNGDQILLALYFQGCL